MVKRIHLYADALASSKRPARDPISGLLVHIILNFQVTPGARFRVESTTDWIWALS